MEKEFIIKKDAANKDKHLCAYLGNDTIVSVPDGVTDIDYYAFADDNHPNDTITKIILPDSVKKIDTKAFAFCRALKELRWPDNDDFFLLFPSLFYGCDSLEKILIPKNVKSIVSLSFPKNVTTVEIHDDITAANQYAFVYDEELAFDGIPLSNVNTIRILLSNPNYKIIDGFMVNLKHKVALFYMERNKKKVRVPDGIEIISMECFDEYDLFKLGLDENKYLHSKLVPVEEVIIPATVKKIAGAAFNRCRKLKSVIYEGNRDNLDAEEDVFIECDGMNRLEAKIICADTKEPKKKRTNLALERIVIIHKEIKSGDFPNTRQLRDICRIRVGMGKLSIATISRDLDFLRSRFNAPIEYDSTKRGYYYKNDFELKF